MTSIQPGTGWAERLNPRNWTLTWKLVVVGLVPALLALTVGALRIADDAEQAAELGRGSRLVEVRDQAAGAANALRQERDEAALYVAGNRTGDRGVLEIGFGQADGEIEEMLNALRGTAELDPGTVSALRRTEDALGRLDRLRASVNGQPPVPYDQVVERYTNIIGPVDALDRAVLRQLRNPTTTGLADAATAVTGAVEQLSVEHTVIGAAIRAGKPLPSDAALVNAANAQLAAEYRDYQASLTPEQLATFGLLPDPSANSRRDQLRTGILAAPFELGPLRADWDAAYAASRADADRTANLIRGELVAASGAAESQASNRAGINSVILMLGLLIGITIAVLVARDLVRSLRVLRTSALDVAERRLPQTVESVRAGDTPDVTVAPVPLTGRDEVVQVARAFDAVHMQAIRLAADQATLQAGISAMFVNLSRRSQALVERQLQLIEQLESNEQDADQLSNLFQLDHLATRMRRNSENLLVLAGTDVAKRNVAAVPMVDVLRAAVSEVEQYQRIVVQTPPTSTILGRAASDIVHLLAELLDNATNFSPPDSQVVMSSTRTADGAIVVEIADRGVGMTDEELVAANSRLSGPSSVDVSTSRRMGLIVVGRLATRHGVDVRLSSSTAGGSGSGLTASVTVPTKLVPTSEPRRSGTLAGTGMARQPAGPAAAGVPPQRNGVPSRPSAPLADLVSRPESPVGPPPRTADQPAAANGSVNGLPTRKPGSALRATGPTPFDQRTSEPNAGPSPFERPGADPGPTAERPDPAPAAEPAPVDRTGPRALAGPADPGQGDRPATPAAGPTPPAAADRPPAREEAPRVVDAAPRSPATGPGGAERAGAERAGAERAEAERAEAERADSVNGTEPPVAPAEVDGPGPRTDPTPLAAPSGNGAAQHRPSPQRRPAAPRPFPRDGVPNRPDADRRSPVGPPTSGLFASRVPAKPEPGSAARPGPRFDPNETTPIFEEIASAWFRSNRSVPVQYGPGPDEAGAAPRPAPAREPSTPSVPFEGVTPARAPRAEPAGADRPAADPVGTDRLATHRLNADRVSADRVDGDRVDGDRVDGDRAGHELATTGRPVDHGFANLADEGWRAARGASSTRGDELTPAGLPKRRPRARLVPGSAGSAVLAPAATPSRSAESIRGRLASYQQGVRMGRENRLRGDAEPGSPANGGTEQANAQANQDEESS